jgi:Tfp pilus assembly PilM family ATPase
VNAALQLIERLRLTTRPTAARGLIGLHVSNGAVHAVQLHRGIDGQIHVAASGSEFFDESSRDLLGDPARLRLVVQKLLRQTGCKGRKIYSVMSAAQVRMLSVTYSPSRRQADDQIIARLMQERLDNDLSTYVIDYLPVRSSAGDGDRQALVAVCQRDAVIDYLETLRRCGLETVALEAGPVAVRRLMASASPADMSTSALVINFGSRASYTSMMSGRRLLFDQEVEFGSDVLVDSVSSALDMTPELALRLILKTGLHDAARTDDRAGAQAIREIVRPQVSRLVEDIRRAYLYAAAETHGNVLSQVYLMGSIARWPGAAELISEMADIPARIMPGPNELFPNDSGTEDSPDAGPDLAVATGLALRGLTSDD